jgi:hypothetical protein
MTAMYMFISKKIYSKVATVSKGVISVLNFHTSKTVHLNAPPPTSYLQSMRFYGEFLILNDSHNVYIYNYHQSKLLCVRN